MIEYNMASAKVYIEKCGWVVEGRKANAQFRNGRYWDKIIVGITRARYREIVKVSEYWNP